MNRPWYCWYTSRSPGLITFLAALELALAVLGATNAVIASTAIGRVLGAVLAVLALILALSAFASARWVKKNGQPARL